MEKRDKGNFKITSFGSTIIVIRGRDENWTDGGIQMQVYTNGDEDDYDEEAYINLTDEAIDELIEALQKAKIVKE